MTVKFSSMFLKDLRKTPKNIRSKLGAVIKEILSRGHIYKKGIS